MNNIYIKLQNARVKLQKSDLSKSGENKFAGFKYFELGDFLPRINEIMQEEKLCSYINFSETKATLTIINAENPDEKIEFNSDAPELQLKGTNAIQNQGGKITYLRRYLYMNAFEITENDLFDAVSGKDTGKVKDNVSELISEKQCKLLYAKGAGKEEKVKEILKFYGFKDSKSITKEKFSLVLSDIEAIK